MSGVGDFPIIAKVRSIMNPGFLIYARYPGLFDGLTNSYIRINSNHRDGCIVLHSVLPVTHRFLITFEIMDKRKTVV